MASKPHSKNQNYNYNLLMENKVLLDKEAREKIKEGVDLVANIVKKTLGASGQNVMCVRDGMIPVITKDGVSIAREVQSDDPIVNAGVLMVKQIAIKTDSETNDGTTSSTTLAQAIVEKAHEALNKGANAVQLKRGIDKASQEAIKELRVLSQKSSKIATLKNIAQISANGDKEISDLVVSAFKKVGHEGIIKVEETESINSSIELTKGYEFDSPFSSWAYITDRDKFTAEFEDMNVLLYAGYLENIKELDASVEASSKDGVFKGLLIIADQISTEAERELIKLKSAGNKIMYVKSPSFGSRRIEVLEDIASLIGAKVYSQDTGSALENVTAEGIGKIKKVVSDVNSTILIGGTGDTTQRIETVKQQTKTISGGKKEKDFVKERLAKLNSGIAIIRVGGYSEVERREKTDRVEDALGAVKACLEEGYVAGGGATYLKIAEKLKKSTIETKSDSEKQGVEVVIEALSAPFRQILLNAATESAEIEKQIREGEYGYGYNLRTELYEDLFKAGVIDPTKVSRMALQNATSISGTFLSTGGIVFNNTPLFKVNENS